MKIFKLSPDEKYFTTLTLALQAARENLPGSLDEYRFNGFPSRRKMQPLTVFNPDHWKRKLRTEPDVYVEYRGVDPERWRQRPSGYFCIEPIDVIDR